MTIWHHYTYVGEDSWESLGLQGDPASLFWKISALGFLWREWCWSWNASTLATSCEELTHWKRLWCWERLGAGGEGDDRGWDGWMASLTQWTWVWVNSRSWWWTGRSGMLQFMGSQRVRHDWATELNWTEIDICMLGRSVWQTALRPRIKLWVCHSWDKAWSGRWLKCSLQSSRIPWTFERPGKIKKWKENLQLAILSWSS